MPATSATARLKSVLFIAVFFLAAAAISYQLVRRHTDYVTLTINHEWRIYLINENNIYAAEYRAADFSQEKLDSRHLWLNGYGTITWHNNRIRVQQAGIYLNHAYITKSHRNTLANILFARDGTVRKEMLEARPSD
jgi:hypothetical protein